jgi:hypothetical protein
MLSSGSDALALALASFTCAFSGAAGVSAATAGVGASCCCCCIASAGSSSSSSESRGATSFVFFCRGTATTAWCPNSRWVSFHGRYTNSDTTSSKYSCTTSAQSTTRHTLSATCVVGLQPLASSRSRLSSRCEAAARCVSTGAARTADTQLHQLGTRWILLWPEHAFWGLGGVPWRGYGALPTELIPALLAGGTLPCSSMRRSWWRRLLRRPWCRRRRRPCARPTPRRPPRCRRGCRGRGTAG